MAKPFRDYFLQSPNSRSATPEEEPPKLPDAFRIFPTPDPTKPFGNLPKIQPPPSPINIWNRPPIPAASPTLPTWPVPTLPSPPTTDPFPDPSIPQLPPMPIPRQPSPYDLDPSNFPGRGGNEPGGLLGRLLALQDEQARNADDAYGSYDPDRSRVAPPYATAPQEIPAAPQKPVRILSRRVVR